MATEYLASYKSNFSPRYPGITEVRLNGVNATLARSSCIVVWLVGEVDTTDLPFTGA